MLSYVNNSLNIHECNIMHTDCDEKPFKRKTDVRVSCLRNSCSVNSLDESVNKTLETYH